MHDDTRRMRRALELARRGLYTTAPNPRVGCVLVKNDAVVGEGWHQYAGEAHAEVHALRAAGDAARGATAYITLEPCAHHGRTPPCADALIAAGIARAVVACRDPNPLVAGQGIARLRAAGVAVTENICAAEAAALNRGFFRRISSGRPFVTLKLAASLDGRTALANGDSQWITGAAARLDAHQQRLAADAVIAGTGSIIADNARLTARYPTDLPARQPLRVIIDSQLRTPPTAAVFSENSPILIACGEAAGAPAYPAHAERLRLPLADGPVPRPALLDALGRRGINNALVEAGAGLAGAFLRAQLADEILYYLAPCLLGPDARPLAALPPLATLSAKMRFTITATTPLGADLRLTLTPETPCSQAS